MKTIPLTRGHSAIVDDEDFDRLSQFKWREHHGYAATGGRKTTIYMHRMILDVPNGLVVDHRDGNGLNNCRANIRPATNAENLRNRKTARHSKSGLKGAHRLVGKTQFYSKITHAGVTRYLGCFPNAESASNAYRIAAAQLHGEFAPRA